MVILNEYLQKVKTWFKENKSDILIAVFIFLISLASFGLGRLSILWPEKEPVTITSDELRTMNAPDQKEKVNSSLTVKVLYVASKSGTSYHYPWCAGALKIKEENKIWFQTKGEAESRGYKPAGNCPGL